jgi:hypothetical protein
MRKTKGKVERELLVAYESEVASRNGRSWESLKRGRAAKEVNALVF